MHQSKKQVTLFWFLATSHEKFFFLSRFQLLNRFFASIRTAYWDFILGQKLVLFCFVFDIYLLTPFRYLPLYPYNHLIICITPFSLSTLASQAYAASTPPLPPSLSSLSQSSQIGLHHISSSNTANNTQIPLEAYANSGGGGPNNNNGGLSMPTTRVPYPHGISVLPPLPPNAYVIQQTQQYHPVSAVAMARVNGGEYFLLLSS